MDRKNIPSLKHMEQESPMDRRLLPLTLSIKQSKLMDQTSTATPFMSNKKLKTPSQEDGMWKSLVEIQAGAELPTSKTINGSSSSVTDLQDGTISYGLLIAEEHYPSLFIMNHRN